MKHIVETLGNYNPYNHIQYFVVDKKRTIPMVLKNEDISEALSFIYESLEIEDQREEDEKKRIQEEQEVLEKDEKKRQEIHDTKKKVLENAFREWITEGFSQIFISSNEQKDSSRENYFYDEVDALKEIYGLEEKKEDLTK